MTNFSSPPSGVCYRHPDRPSFVLCQRCGRTICPECQTPAAVGVHCPECVREQRSQFAATARANGNGGFARAGRRFARIEQKGTVGIIAVTVFFWLLDLVTGGAITQLFAYNAALLPTQPWRLVTSVLVHSGIVHIALNMWSLWVFGQMLERVIGSWRLIVVYALTGIGGSAVVTMLAPSTTVVGASGAIFGFIGAYFVLYRRLGGNPVGLLVLVALNLVIGFLPGTNIAWQAHVGGLAFGAILGLILWQTQRAKYRWLQVTLLAAVLVIAVVIAYGSYAFWTSR